MTASEIQHRFTDLLVEHLKCRADDVVADAMLNNLGADSLDKVEIVMFCESEFGIDISDNAAAKMETVLDFVKHIHAELNPAPPPVQK
jgi:acyl carrier protein